MCVEMCVEMQMMKNWMGRGTYKSIVGGDDGNDINSLLLELLILLHIRRQMLDLTPRGKRSRHRKQHYLLPLEPLLISVHIS